MESFGEKIAAVFVQVGADLAPYYAALGMVKKSVFSLASMPIRFPGGGLMAAMGIGPGTLGVAGAVLGLRHVLHAASDLNESMNMAKVVFSDSFGTISGFADQMAKKFGIVRKEVYDSTASFGAFAQGQGFSTQASADFAAQMTQLAADLSSAKNIRFDEAMIKIQAALAGEAEPLRRYGVDILQTTVAHYALTHGIAASAKEMTSHQKVLARAALITQGLKFATGDLARTIEDPANAGRAAVGRLENISETIGMQLLPAYKAWHGLINEVLIDVTEASGGMKSSLETFVDYAKGGIELVSYAWRNAGDIIEYYASYETEALENVGRTFSWLGDTIQAFGSYLMENWPTLLQDAFTAGVHILNNFVGVWRDAFIQIGNIAMGKEVDWSKFNPLEGWRRALDFHGVDFKSPAFKAPTFPEMANREAERDVIADRMAERERKRAALGDLSGGEGKAEAAAGGAVPGKERKAEIVNVSSIANELAKAALGQKDPLLKEAQAQTTKLDEIAKNTAKAAAGGGKAKFAAAH